MADWIDLNDITNERRTSLQVGDVSLRVTGNLPHGTEVMPASREDAVHLLNWLIRWIDEIDYRNLPKRNKG